MRRTVYFGGIAASVASFVLAAAAANAHDRQPPDYRGDPLSAFFHWLPADPETPGSGVLPVPQFSWVDDDDPATFFLEHLLPGLLAETGANGEYLIVELPNFVDELPLKLLRVRLTWTGASPPTITEALGFSGLTSVASGSIDYSSPIQPYTQPTGGYQYHDLSIRPNPDWERLTIHVPDGVVIDQIVVDTISMVPEPSSLVVLASGAAAMLLARARHRRASRRAARSVVLAAFALLASALPTSAARADVFNMPSGLTSLEFVTVGHAGNAPDSLVVSDGTSGYGAVGYVYGIGKFEITAAQYTVFLNAVAAEDPHGLYSPQMWTDPYGCKIERNGAPGSYSYGVAADYANRPVNWVSWGDAARFANWLHNGQPGLLAAVPQDANSTEDGAYLLNGAMDNAALMAVMRNPGALYWIPSEDEWYKAAYHDPTKGSGGD